MPHTRRLVKRALGLGTALLLTGSLLTTGVFSESALSKPENAHKKAESLAVPQLWQEQSPALATKPEPPTVLPINQVLEAALQQPRSKGLGQGTSLPSNLWPGWQGALQPWLEQSTIWLMPNWHTAWAGLSGEKRSPWWRRSAKKQEQAQQVTLEALLEAHLALNIQQQVLQDYFDWAQATIRLRQAIAQRQYHLSQRDLLLYRFKRGEITQLALLAHQHEGLNLLLQEEEARSACALRELSLRQWLEQADYPAESSPSRDTPLTEQENRYSPDLATLAPEPESTLSEAISAVPLDSAYWSEPAPVPFSDTLPQSVEKTVSLAQTHRPEWQLLRWMESQPSLRLLGQRKQRGKRKNGKEPLEELRAQLLKATRAVSEKSQLTLRQQQREWQHAMTQERLAQYTLQQAKGCAATGLCPEKQIVEAQSQLQLAGWQRQIAQLRLKQAELELAGLTGQLGVLL